MVYRYALIRFQFVDNFRQIFREIHEIIMELFILLYSNCVAGTYLPIYYFISVIDNRL